MSMNLESISTGATIRAPRILLVGGEKLGKSSFACGTTFENNRVTGAGINSPIVISVKGEEGVDGLNVAKFPTANSFDDVVEALVTLYKEDHDFKTVVLDSASALEPLIFDAVCKDAGKSSIEDVGGGYGKGYLLALEKWRKLCNGLDALRADKGMSSVIIGHIKIKRFNDPNGESFDQYQFDVNEKANALISRWADVSLFCNTKVAVKKEEKGFGQTKNRAIDTTGGQRFLFTQKRPSHPGGGRGVYGQLPYELPLEWTAFENAVASVAASYNTNQKKEK